MRRILEREQTPYVAVHQRRGRSVAGDQRPGLGQRSGFEPLDDELAARVLAANDQLAQDGLRVLGVAFRPLDASAARADRGKLEQQWSSSACSA